MLFFCHNGLVFNRKIEKELLEWKEKPKRKPLILRGARQTGKTTIVRKFAEQFRNLVELNLEKDSSQKIFSEIRDIKDVVQSIEGVTNQRIIPGESLLFLDEIQNSISAIKLLRYFYEEMPGLHVISTGSLLEVRMKKEGWSFPVGRVEFLYLYPVTFEEYLSALGEGVLLDMLQSCSIRKPLPGPLHDKLTNLVADYIIIGGMPEAVYEYINSHSFISVKKIHEALTLSFKEDFVKYAKGAEVSHLKLVWDNMPFAIGSRIKYSKIAGDAARSNDISGAFDILHEAMLVERILPTTHLSLPLVKKSKASPKAILVDIGLCSHVLKLTREQVGERLLNPVYGGALLEEFAGQELLALDVHNREQLYFWMREEKGACSELDFLIPNENGLIPIEIKSGSHGSLKSLHQFLMKSRTNLGVRIYSGPLKIENHSVKMTGEEILDYQLLSIPFYLIFRLNEITKDEI